MQESLHTVTMPIRDYNKLTKESKELKELKNKLIKCFDIDSFMKKNQIKEVNSLDLKLNELMEIAKEQLDFDFTNIIIKTIQ